MIFEKLSLMNLIFSLFWTACKNRVQIRKNLDIKLNISNSIFQKSSAVIQRKGNLLYFENSHSAYLVVKKDFPSQFLMWKNRLNFHDFFSFEINIDLGAHFLLLTHFNNFLSLFVFKNDAQYLMVWRYVYSQTILFSFFCPFFGNLKPTLPKYVSSGSPIFFRMYFWLIGLDVGLVLTGDHLLCWFFLGMLKLGAGSPVFFRISKRLIEGAIEEFQGFEPGQKMDRLSCPVQATLAKTKIYTQKMWAHQ